MITILYTSQRSCMNQEPFSGFLKETHPGTVEWAISISVCSDIIDGLNGLPGGAPGGGEEIGLAS